jgi:hypothetical protein
MRDRKNINKFALSHEKVLISGYGNGRLPAYLPLAAVTFYLPQRSWCVARDEILVDMSASFAYKEALDRKVLRT